MIDVKEALNNYKQLEQEQRELQGKIAALNAKRAEIEAQLPDFEKQKSTAEKDKKAAYDRFILDEISRDKLDDATRQLESAVRAEKDAAEMLEAIDRNIRDIQAKVHNMALAYGSARINVWRGICQDLQEKARTASGVLVRKAIAAGSMASQGAQHVLEGIFPSLPPDELKTIRAELEKEYLGE